MSLGWREWHEGRFDVERSMKIDLTTNHALVNWLRGYPNSMVLNVMVQGKRQECAEVGIVGNALYVVCSAKAEPTAEETTAALNAGMVEGAPEAA